MLGPDLCPCRSSVSLYGKQSLNWCLTKRLNAAKQGVDPRQEQEQNCVQVSMESAAMDHFQVHLSKEV